MSEDTSLWALAANAGLGVVLVGWMLLTLPWILLGSEPPVPGGDIAFVSTAAWAGWNARMIMRPAP